MRLSDTNISESIAALKTVFELFNAFALFAIFIASLGLVGLASLTAKRRMKEIGIRKSMGASVAGVTMLLSMDFLKLVLIAFVLATPLTYLAMSEWLKTFAYRTELDVMTFLIGGMAALIIAWVTVSY